MRATMTTQDRSQGVAKQNSLARFETAERTSEDVEPGARLASEPRQLQRSVLAFRLASPVPPLLPVQSPVIGVLRRVLLGLAEDETERRERHDIVRIGFSIIGVPLDLVPRRGKRERCRDGFVGAQLQSGAIAKSSPPSCRTVISIHALSGQSSTVSPPVPAPRK